MPRLDVWILHGCRPRITLNELSRITITTMALWWLCVQIFSGLCVWSGKHRSWHKKRIGLVSSFDWHTVKDKNGIDKKKKKTKKLHTHFCQHLTIVFVYALYSFVNSCEHFNSLCGCKDGLSLMDVIFILS